MMYQLHIFPAITGREFIDCPSQTLCPVSHNSTCWWCAAALFFTVGKVGKMVKVSLPHLQKGQTCSVLVNSNVLAGSNHLEFLSLCLLLEYLPIENTRCLLWISGIWVNIWIPQVASSALLQIKDNHIDCCETLMGKKALRLRGEIFQGSECIHRQVLKL